MHAIKAVKRSSETSRSPRTILLLVWFARIRCKILASCSAISRAEAVGVGVSAQDNSLTMVARYDDLLLDVKLLTTTLR